MSERLLPTVFLLLEPHGLSPCTDCMLGPCTAVTVSTGCTQEDGGRHIHRGEGTTMVGWAYIPGYTSPRVHLSPGYTSPLTTQGIHLSSHHPGYTPLFTQGIHLSSLPIPGIHLSSLPIPGIPLGYSSHPGYTSGLFLSSRYKPLFSYDPGYTSGFNLSYSLFYRV